ncbi:uncharacterized protein FIESC28_06762 [Fusarium coffeatum]|uniref:Uncharacterized protein n=1 Tax=Fusarium coffeatum TaxID=231269 RepID=A0A366RIB8_9HYPO|nr:uncharacterized protein FIESC28_06762 [Fusarium coffeatum]RBR16847.1 hypothetical protein FIESC28_06762 [Fusarium coffeatum]
MPPEGDMNIPGERSHSPERNDTEHGDVEEEISETEMDLLALEEVVVWARDRPTALLKELCDIGIVPFASKLAEVVSLAKREAAAIRQRLGDVEESGNDVEESGNDLPANEPGLMLAEVLANIDMNLLHRGLSYLKSTLEAQRWNGSNEA